MNTTGRESFDPRYSAHQQPANGMGDAGSLDHILSVVERKEIIKALQRAGGRRTLAARILGISRSRLYRRMEALAIPFPEPPEGGSGHGFWHYAVFRFCQ